MNMASHTGLVFPFVWFAFLSEQSFAARGTLSVSSQSHHHYVHIIVESVFSPGLSRVLMRAPLLSLSLLLFGIQNNEPASYPKRSQQPTNQNHQPWQNESCVPNTTHTHIACEKSLCFI